MLARQALLSLEPLYQPFLMLGIFKIGFGKLLPRLADFCLLSS
jgi:hypothetical protein